MVTAMMLLALFASLSVINEPATLCDLPAEYLPDIREQRLAGALVDAHSAANEMLDCVMPPEDRVALLIELATIEDRVGLHQNTRPVPAVQRAIDKAAQMATELGDASKAVVALAKSDYFYRAEMSERKFEQAEHHAKNAANLFEQLGDKHGQSDAVHRLGLIHFQRRTENPEQELERARELFELSRDLDEAGGARAHFCGEYGRHVGYIYYVRGDFDAALPYFEQSLECRKQAGAIDASLFAAQTLGSTLIRAGQPEKAEAPILYGLVVALRMDSPVGIARLSYTLGDMYLATSDDVAAREAYAVALGAAERVDYTSHVEASLAALAALETPGEE